MAKKFKKTYLPDSIDWNGDTYTRNSETTTGMENAGTDIRAIEKELRKQDRKMIVVSVLSSNLRGKTDLHGKPYQPSVHIFTNYNKEQ